MSRIAVLVAWMSAAAAIVAAGIGLGVDNDPLPISQPETLPVNSVSQSKPQSPFAPAAVEPSVAEILGRSPLDTGRRAFSRDLPEPPPPPPLPPRLLGISMQNGKRFALLEWPATGQTQRVSEGDGTELGKVKAIDASGIAIAGKDGEFTVSLFP